MPSTLNPLNMGLSDKNMIFSSISHDNNMNAVRYYLSMCVLVSHTAVLTGINYPSFQTINMVVGCFFALSGFLMFPSFQRNPSMKGYLSRRARKIMPSYVFIVLLAAFGLVFISTLSATDYFSNWGFYRYLLANLSFLNFLGPELPGVFSGDAYVTDAVNGSLWTMKGEWVCYLSVPLVYNLVVKLGRKRGTCFLLGIVLAGIGARLLLLSIADDEHSLAAIIARQFGTVFVFFYSGALINICWDKFLKYKWYIIAVDAAIIIFCDYIPIYYTLLQPFVGASTVLWFSLIGNWGAKLSRHDSVSYDIYLFHFPIIQLAVGLGLPASVHPAWLLIVISVVTIALAFFSWNVIGRRFQPGYDRRSRC